MPGRPTTPAHLADLERYAPFSRRIKTNFRTMPAPRIQDLTQRPTQETNIDDEQGLMYVLIHRFLRRTQLIPSYRAS